jgi:hypothetical protein
MLFGVLAPLNAVVGRPELRRSSQLSSGAFSGWWVRILSTGDADEMNSWHHGIMAKRSNPKRDFMEVARNIVENAIGEQMDGRPLPEPEPDTRNPHAVALGSNGWTERRKGESQEPFPRTAS